MLPRVTQLAQNRGGAAIAKCVMLPTLFSVSSDYRGPSALIAAPGAQDR